MKLLNYNILTSAKLTILNKLGNKELIIPKQKGPNDVIEFNILNDKLKGAKANKEGLKQRLDHIDNSISSLDNLLNLQKKAKKRKI